MSDTKTIKVHGVSTLGLLGLLFVCLKLTGHIDWSWLWVTAPWWAPTGLVLVVVATGLVLTGLVLLVAWCIDAIRGVRRSKQAKARRAP